MRGKRLVIEMIQNLLSLTITWFVTTLFLLQVGLSMTMVVEVAHLLVDNDWSWQVSR